MPNSTPSLDLITEQYTTMINTLCNIAESYFYLGKLNEAIKVLSVGVQFLEENEVAAYAQVKLLLQYGRMLTESTFHTNRSSEEALSVLFRAQQLAESIEDQRLIADALNELGQTYFFRAHKVAAKANDYETALVYFQQALELREAIHDERGICESLLNVGKSYQNAGQGDKSEPYLIRAVQLADQQQHLLIKAETMGHLGILAVAKGDLLAAHQLVAEALTIREEIGLRICFPYSHLTLAEILHTQGDLQTALTHYQKACTLAQEMHVAPVTCASLMGIGYVHLDQGEVEQAQECFEKAYAAAKASDLQTGIQEAEEGLAEITKLQNEDAHANERTNP